MTSVLVCDDSPLAREALRRAVATVPGVERVTTAANGEEVLRRWGADRSDLILMDVRMPGLGGVETVRRLLSADPGARIIMLTVAEDLDGVALAVAAGAAAICTRTPPARSCAPRSRRRSPTRPGGSPRAGCARPRWVRRPRSPRVRSRCWRG